MSRLSLIILLLASIGCVNAQNPDLKIISSAGGSTELGSLTLDWTVGEIATLSIQSASNLITQGFHQPVLKVTAIEELESAIGEIKVYPNPTSDFLQMELEFHRIRSVRIDMYDTGGRNVRSAEATGRLISQSIQTHGLPAGNYILHFLIDGNQYRKTLKIQKIN